MFGSEPGEVSPEQCACDCEHDVYCTGFSYREGKCFLESTGHAISEITNFDYA